MKNKSGQNRNRQTKNFKKKLAKRLILFLLVCLLAFALCYGYYAYNTYLIPRMGSNHLIYEPFSGKLFDLDLQEVESIYIRRIWQIEDIDTSSYPSEYWGQRYDTPEEISTVLQKFNSFRYAFWVPKTFSHRQDFYCPGFSIILKDGKRIMGAMWKNHCLIGEFGERDVWSQGAWYFGSSDLYDALMAVDIEESSE